MTLPLTLPSPPKRGRGIQRERRDCFLPSPPVGGKDSKRAPGLFPSLSLSRREGFKESAGTVSIPLPQSEGRIQRERRDCFLPLSPSGGEGRVRGTTARRCPRGDGTA